MSPEVALAGAVVLAVLSFGLGLLLGLYRGERARRLDSHNREKFGHPTSAPARVIPQPVDAEERARNLGYSEATIERGIQDLQKTAAERGYPVPSREEARQQALALLHPETMMEGLFPS